MRKNCFALLRMFMCVAFVPTLSLGLVSCEPEKVTDTELVENGGSEDNSGGNSEESVCGAVDLGLSVKWASCNVGAESPEDYGSYFAWGEIEAKSDYSWSTYKWCNGNTNSMTKYCTDSSYGTVDNKTTLNPEDDVAHVSWGDGWRMPTLDEIKELLNPSKCTWSWTTQNGVNGYKVTGPNGNSIFLPAAGSHDGTKVNNRGSRGDYWFATLSEYYDYHACSLYFYDGYWGWSSFSRHYGRTVRPVTD